MAGKNPKTRQNKPNETREPSSTKWLRVLLIVFSIMLILSMILSLTSR